MNDNSKKSNPRADVSAAFNYLVDEPAIEDRFGAHTAIVNAIVSTLRTQRHIRLIGLIGRWGTGKSTIVGRLAATLQHKHKDEYVLFAYDAWAHQGDPARRSILEELIARLVGLKLTKPSKWRDTLLAVSGSSESSSTTTRTRLSTWGKFVVAMLLMFPVFAVLIDSETLRKAFADYPDRLSLILIRAFLLYVMLVGLIIFAAHVFTKEYRPLFDRQIPFRDRLRAFRASGEDILSIMLTRRFPGTSSTTLRKSQPTAIEFRRYPSNNANILRPPLFRIT